MNFIILFLILLYINILWTTSYFIRRSHTLQMVLLTYTLRLRWNVRLVVVDSFCLAPREDHSRLYFKLLLQQIRYLLFICFFDLLSVCLTILQFWIFPVLLILTFHLVYLEFKVCKLLMLLFFIYISRRMSESLSVRVRNSRIGFILRFYFFECIV